MNKRSHILMLFLTALLWGTTFVAQSIGADYVGPWTYLAGRSWVAVLFLTALLPPLDRFFVHRGIEQHRPKSTADRKLLWIGGAACGVMLCAASFLQQFGIAYTTSAKAGFITALYVILVPILSIFVKKRPSARIWVCVAVSLVGMYLLCMTSERFSLQVGDTYVLLSALFFAFQIMLLDTFSPQTDGVRLSRVQFLVVAAVSTVCMVVLEKPSFDFIVKALPAILYAGIFSSGVGFTLQIIAQQSVTPTLASLIMSLESVFAALSGWVILGEGLSLREFIGCALMFAATVFAQISPRAKPEA